MNASPSSADEALALLRRTTPLLNDDVGSAQRLVASVREAWDSEIRNRPACPADAETCRMAMLACLELGREHRPVGHELSADQRALFQREAAVWRVRAIIRAAHCHWMDGLMALMMSEALRLQARINDDGHPFDSGYEVAPEAFTILDELVPFIGSDGPTEDGYRPSPRFTGRQYHEKTGFLLIAAGEWDAARAAFEQALNFVDGDDRGRIKVQLHIEAMRYLARVADPAETASRTLALADEARGLSRPEKGLAEIADANVQLMRRGASALEPYEIL